MSEWLVMIRHMFGHWDCRPLAGLIRRSHFRPSSMGTMSHPSARCRGTPLDPGTTSQYFVCYLCVNYRASCLRSFLPSDSSSISISPRSRGYSPRGNSGGSDRRPGNDEDFDWNQIMRKSAKIIANSPKFAKHSPRFGKRAPNFRLGTPQVGMSVVRLLCYFCICASIAHNKSLNHPPRVAPHRIRSMCKSTALPTSAAKV